MSFSRPNFLGSDSAVFSSSIGFDDVCIHAGSLLSDEERRWGRRIVVLCHFVWKSWTIVACHIIACLSSQASRRLEYLAILVLSSNDTCVETESDGSVDLFEERGGTLDSSNDCLPFNGRFTRRYE